MIGFLLEHSRILDAVVARQPANQLAAFPVGENAVDIFARDTRERSKFALVEFLADDDAALSDVFAEVILKFQ